MSPGVLRVLLAPDHLPVLAMLTLLPGFVGWALWRGRANDRLCAAGREAEVLRRMAHGDPAARVHSWPYLVRVELLAALAATVVLLVWSLAVDAPLEPRADPTRTPNPAKAPWYFVGLQELLVYFDPWLAGVVLPLTIIGGLAAVPYLSTRVAGAGRYGLRGRGLAVGLFLAGNLLWALPIVVGVFFRGPGWGFTLPWAAGRVIDAAVPTRSLAAALGVGGAAGSVLGAAACAAWYAPALIYWLRRPRSARLQRLGPGRYALAAFLTLSMAALPAKVVLQLVFKVKYVWVTPWFSV